jgi:hypothetical protein
MNAISISQGCLRRLKRQNASSAARAASDTHLCARSAEFQSALRDVEMLSASFVFGCAPLLFFHK